MKRLIPFVVICAALCSDLTAGAFAQAIPFDWRNEVPDANDDFTRCMNRDRANAERTVRSCGRVIAERFSSEYTAAGHYSRGLMREMLQDTAAAQEDFINAERLFTTAINATDRHTDAYRNRAAARYRLGRYEEAVADYEQALAVVTNARSDRGTRVRSGVADLRTNQISGLHSRIGGVQFKAGNWNEAREAFDRAAETSPNVAAYQAGRCEARAAAQVEMETAQAACDRALELSDRSTEALFSLGFLQFAQEDFGAAISSFSSAAAGDSENYLARYAHGVSIARLGQVDAGRAEMDAAAQQIDASTLAYYVDAGLSVAP